MEPFVLFVNKKFMDKASKVFGLGFLARKRMLQIFEKLGIQFLELDREGAKNAIEKIGEARGVNVSTSQVVKGLALAFFLPSGLFVATMKKVHYICGMETDGFVFLEFLAEIPRAFRTTLFYGVWLVVPKDEKGAEMARQLIKDIVRRVGEIPLNDEDWENLRAIREKLSKLEVKGISENHWNYL